MQCPTCYKENPAESRFCQFCGAQLASVTQTEAKPVTPAKPAAERPQAEGAGAITPQRPGQSPAPSRKRPPTPPASKTPAGGQLGDGGTTAADIWGPFAGYGERGHYASWLLDDLAPSADDLYHAISERFRERQVPGARGGWKTMTARGIVVEQRPFYLIKRGITTVALYIGQFGKDLFISQVTYAKGPISNVRAIVLAVMLLFQLYFMFGYTSSINNALSSISLFGGGSGAGNLGFLLCIVGPVGFLNTLLLGLAFVYSFYKWLTIKDFLALLRVPPNEFQLDDIVALEKSVEETVRQSLDSINIDTALMPPAQSYGFEGRIL